MAIEIAPKVPNDYGPETPTPLELMKEFVADPWIENVEAEARRNFDRCAAEHEAEWSVVSRHRIAIYGASGTAWDMTIAEKYPEEVDATWGELAATTYATRLADALTYMGSARFEGGEFDDFIEICLSVCIKKGYRLLHPNSDDGDSRTRMEQLARLYRRGPVQGIANSNDAATRKPNAMDSARRTAVDVFLARCNQEKNLPEKVLRKHIWRSVEHKTPRQFQYWQKAHDKATDIDATSFARIIEMTPSAFIALLKKKGLLPQTP